MKKLIPLIFVLISCATYNTSNVVNNYSDNEYMATRNLDIVVRLSDEMNWKALDTSGAEVLFINNYLAQRIKPNKRQFGNVLRSSLYLNFSHRNITNKDTLLGIDALRWLSFGLIPTWHTFEVKLTIEMRDIDSRVVQTFVYQEELTNVFHVFLIFATPFISPDKQKREAYKKLIQKLIYDLEQKGYISELK